MITITQSTKAIAYVHARTPARTLTCLLCYTVLLTYTHTHTPCPHCMFIASRPSRLYSLLRRIHTITLSHSSCTVYCCAQSILQQHQLPRGFAVCTEVQSSAVVSHPYTLPSVNSTGTTRLNHI